MNQYRLGGFQMLPPVVKNLLIINVIMFLATNVFQSTIHVNLNDVLGLHWIGSEKFEVYQVVTYMFMHGSFQHIFFNMFAVWMFGSAVENYWGAKRFLTYYVATGIGAAVIHYVTVYFGQLLPFNQVMNAFLEFPSTETLREFVSYHNIADYIHPSVDQTMYEYYRESINSLNAMLNGNATKDQILAVNSFMLEYKEYYLNFPNVVGASGSLFGLLLAFGMLFPNQRIFMIFLPIPIKAKYFVMAYGAIELFSGLSNRPGDNVAHFAHLGGMIFGFLLIRYWQKHDNTYNRY